MTQTPVRKLTHSSEDGTLAHVGAESLCAPIAPPDGVLVREDVQDDNYEYDRGNQCSRSDEKRCQLRAEHG